MPVDRICSHHAFLRHMWLKASSDKLLRMHIQAKHDERVLKCEKCEVTCKGGRKLKTHMDSHREVNCKHCDQCSYACTLFSALRRHNDITLEKSHTLVANIGRTFLQYVFNVFFHQYYLVKITLVTLIWLVSSVLHLCRLNALR